MKSISIKLKITIWYLTFITILLVINLLILFYFSGQIVSAQSKEDLIENVDDIIEHLLVLDNGPIYYDDDHFESFTYYKDNTSFFFYKEDTIMFGQSPINEEALPEINLGLIQTIDIANEQYMIYDILVDNNYTLRAITNITENYSSVNQLIVILLITSPLVILFSGIGGYIILKKSFRPISEISKTALNITKNSSYHLRIPLQEQKNELSELIQVINEMLSSVEIRIEREKLFTSNVSHELRTPLTILKIQVEYLEQKMRENEFLEDIQVIKHQLNYLEEIVKAILMLTKIKENQQFQKSKIDVNSIAENILESYQKEIMSKKITTTLEIQPNVEYFGDQVLLMLLLKNLISNAIKYNKKEGTILIKINTSGDKLIMVVKDNGMGISKEDLTHITEPFYRSDKSRSQEDLSIGIGLSIVESIVKYYSGYLQIESELEIGTAVRVEL